MANQKNPAQIIRKDGNNCFVEVMNSGFSIEKVQFNFYTYNTAAQSGSRLSNGISIYFSFDEFYRICHDITVTRAILSEILKLAQDAKNEGKSYFPAKTLYMGGRSAQSLAKANQSRPDGMSLSRQLKIQAGTKYPVLLIAESGPGQQNEKGLIVPRYQQPESRVTIPFTYETIKELFLITKAHLDAYLAAKYTYMAFHPEENQQAGQKNTYNNYQSSQSNSAPNNSGYNRGSQSRSNNAANGTYNRQNSYTHSMPQPNYPQSYSSAPPAGMNEYDSYGYPQNNNAAVSQQPVQPQNAEPLHNQYDGINDGPPEISDEELAFFRSMS